MSIITYEQPLNERIRTLLRLEFLFNQADNCLLGTSPWDSRQSLFTLLDILNIFSRSDLKSEVIMELERQVGYLSRLEQNPDVDNTKLGPILDDMDILLDKLHGTHGQIGQLLKQNEFLSSIKQRCSIPGGTCDFDLPAYHYWLAHHSDKRQGDLKKWFAEFGTIRAAMGMILRLVRDSATSSDERAIAGFFQQTLDANVPYQLIRVALPEDNPCFAEISGGKHRFTIRFMEMNIVERPVQTSRDVNFTLTTCVI